MLQIMMSGNIMKQKSCQNCAHFVRIRSFISRGGICDVFDWAGKCDNSYAKICKQYKKKKYDRKKEK